jgi:hypothetical protein
MTIRVSATEARALLAQPQKAGRFPRAAREARTLDGIVFDSKAEMQRYAALKQMERAGVISNLELQPEFPVMLNGERLCVFTADFRYFDAAGACVIEDAKSSGTQQDRAYRLRKRAAELFYGVKVTEVIS